MAQQIIDVGVIANSGDGDSLYASGNKINNNFGDFFDLVPVKADIKFFGNNITSRLSNADIDIHPSGTGSIVFPGIRIKDNNIETTRTNDDIRIMASGSGYVVIDGIGFNAGTSIHALDSSIINVNENLIVDGNTSVAGGFDFATTKNFLTGSTFGSLTLADGSITDSSGAISFGDENLTTTGTLTAATGSSIGNLTLANASITDSSGAISFGNENLTTSGTITAATGSTIGNLTLANGSITDSSGTISFGNENLTTSASSMSINSTLTAGSGSITDSTGAISFGNDNLTTSGNMTVDGATTMANMAVSGATSFAAPVTVDNLTFNDNIISTSSNADLKLTPGGTGVVNVSNLTIDSSINFTDNVVKVTTSNADLILSGSGTGSVEINRIDLDDGTIDNTVIGANDPSTGLFSPLNFDTLVIPTKLTFSGNTLSSSRSNDNLEFEASGSGNVKVNGLALPNADGQTGQFLQTDGSGTLSFVGVSIALGVSTIQDSRNTIGFSSKTLIDANTAVGAHESILADTSVIDEFAQSKYDSAWYLVLNRLEAADSAIEYQLQKSVIAQGTDDGSTFDAFNGNSQIVRTAANQEIQLTSDIRSATGRVRLLGQGGTLEDGSTTSLINAVQYFRIGLGDDDSSGTQAGSGLAQTKLVADLDSAAATLDSWAIADHRAAKYFVSINNTTTNEVSSTEVLLTHDGTNAFISEYNTIVSNGESTPLATFTADISGGNARLRGANGTSGTCRVTMYRILISDDDSASDGTYVDVLGAQNVTNIGQTTIDTNTFRGDAAPDVSSQKTISSFANTFDSVWFHAIHKDQTNNEFAMHKYSANDGITTDGSTRQVGITDSSVLKTGAMNDINVVDVAINGSNIDLKATGQNDGSTAIKNATSYFALGLGDNTATATSGNIKTHAGVTFGGNNETRVDTLTATGTTTSILSSQRTLAEFTATEYDSVWYLGVSNDIENSGLATFKYSTMHGTTSDGSTQDAFITSSSITRTDSAHAHLETDVDVSGSNIRLLGNGGLHDDSAKSNSNTIAYYRFGLGDNDSSSYSSDDGVADTDLVTVGGIQETEIDHVTAHGTHSTLSHSGTTTCAEFTAGQYDSAWFFVVNKDVANGSFETQKISLMHNLQDSFMTNSAIVNTDEGDNHPVYTTDVVTSGDSTSKVRIRSTDNDGSTVANNNTFAYYRIGLGDDDSTGYSGEQTDESSIARVTIGSTVANIDTFARNANNGAKYYISVNNMETGEVSNIEALVTHDHGSNAFIVSYNEHFSGNNSLITLTADIDGTTVRLRGSATVGSNTRVTAYRILLGDTESAETGSNVRTTATVTDVTSAATTIDTIDATAVDAAHYIIVARTGGASGGGATAMEATVVHDGTNAFVTQYGECSSKTQDDTAHLTLSASHNGSSTVTLQASATNAAGGGVNTIVTAYRIDLKAPESSTATIDSFAIANFRGAKYYISVNNLDSNEVSNVECLVVHDGTNAFINQYNEHFSGSSSLFNGDLTTDIDSGNLRLRCVVANDNTRITFYRVLLADAPTTATHTNTKVIGGVTASSSATTVDTFNDTSVDGAHYVIVGYNSSEAAASIQEANVITEGTDAFVSSGPYVSTKGTNQLDLTAEHDGSNTVTLKASSTSGSSTKVAAYRVHMKAPTGQTDNLDTFAKGSYRGAKYYVSAKETVTGYIDTLEAMVVHDGTNSFITTFNEHFSHGALVTLTTDISGSNVRLRCAGNIPDVQVKFYRVLLADDESGSTGTDFNTVAASTVSSSATAIDTFEDTSFTGASYIIVGFNNSESTASIMEATVLTNGTEAFVHEGPYVSSKGTHQLTLTAAHNGSSTVTLSAASTSGSSTTVNAFRVHMHRADRDAYTTLDSFAHSSVQAANYLVAMKDGDSRVQFSEVMLVSDGTDAYHTEFDINSESTTAPFITITSAVNGSNVELRAESTIEQSTTITNIFKIPLARAVGAPTNTSTLDSFSVSDFRSASYVFSISDSGSGERGLYETGEIRITHDGTTPYMSVFGRTTNSTGDLVEFTTDISGGNVRLRGTISSTNTHEVTVVRRLMVV